MFIKKPLRKYFHDEVIKNLRSSHQTPIVQEHRTNRSMHSDRTEHGQGRNVATDPHTDQVATLRPVHPDQVATLRPVHARTRLQRCDRSTHGPVRNVATGQRTDQVTTLWPVRMDQAATLLRPVHIWTRSQRCDRSTYRPCSNVATGPPGSGRNVATGPRTDQVTIQWLDCLEHQSMSKVTTTWIRAFSSKFLNTIFDRPRQYHISLPSIGVIT